MTQHAAVTVSLGRNPAWHSDTRGGLRVHWAGRRLTVEALAHQLESEAGEPNLSALGPLFADAKGHFAAIIEGPGWTLAVADKCRSIPLFFDAGRTVVSNSAQAVVDAVGPLDVDHVSRAEFQAGSYTTGSHTLFTGLEQIRAGESMLWTASGQARTDRYYLFHNANNLDFDADGFVQALDEATTAIFNRLVEDLGGRRVLLPLSAGFDSRLVLAKLLELGHDNIQTFSYGPPGNADAKWAKVLAGKAGVPWLFVPYTHRRVWEFFWSPVRREYWRFAANYSSLPFMVDECALDTLRRENILRPDDVLINGQSGDFISGGHVCGYHLPHLEEDRCDGPRLVVDAVMRKHFKGSKALDGLWPPEASRRVLETLGLDTGGEYGRDALSKVYESWEWQERQAKYVINGQRSYDFLGLEWRLPLWDDEYMHFWPAVPYPLKVGQTLYKDWLQKKDFFGLFKDFDPPMWNWQGWSFVAVPTARAAGLILGREATDTVYRAFAYFGRYANHYAPFGLWRHLRDLPQRITPMTRYAELWLAENI